MTRVLIDLANKHGMMYDDYDLMEKAQEAFEKIRDFSDLEMKDGDAARRAAIEVIGK